MPSASRRKAKQAKKLKTLTTSNHHSSSADQLQGAAVLANHSKKMEGSLNGTLQDNKKVETQSWSQDKEVVVEVDDEKSLTDSSDGDIAITDEEEAPQSQEEKKELVESGKVEETQEVSESIAESFEPDDVKDVLVDNTMESDTVELELKEEQGKVFLSNLAVVNDEVKETDLPPSEDNNEGLGETEVVGEEEKNVLFSVVTEKLLIREGEEAHEVHGDSSLPLTDVASEETVETSVPKSDESYKIAPTISESSYESAKESFSFQPSPSFIPDAKSTENPTIVPVAQRENTSWKSCCGLFEIMRGE